MKIFDCFTIRDELDTLELRLSEHYDHVDHFVISEANKTHRNADKPFNLEENWDRFSAYHDKIIYVKVEDMPEDKNYWVNEGFQRDAISRGLTSAAPDDVIFVSDLDEIVRSTVWQQVRDDSENTVWALRMPTFQFKLNYLLVSSFMPYFYTARTVAVKHSLGLTPTQIKHIRMKDNEKWYRCTMLNFESYLAELPTSPVMYIDHGGWHFTNMENSENKSESLADGRDVNGFDPAHAIPLGYGINRQIMERYVPVQVNDYFPSSIQSSVSAWDSYLIADATATLSIDEPFLEQTGVTFKTEADLEQEALDNDFQLVNYS